MAGKAPERGGCDQVLVLPEAVHGHPVDWTLFRIEVLRARQEWPPGSAIPADGGSTRLGRGPGLRVFIRSPAIAPGCTSASAATRAPISGEGASSSVAA